jgi:hypothetical protein
LSRVDLDRGLGHRLRARESLLRHRSHSARNRFIHVRNVRDSGAFIDDGCVVDVVDGGRVDRRIADVDPIHILAAYVVGGNIDFAWTQWEPSDITSDHAETADEHDQGGRVNRDKVHRTGYPAPTSASTYPAAIMKWRIAPWRVVYPSPTPGSYPRPMTFVIRRPSRIYTVRKPDVTITGIVAPVSIIIQIFVTNDIMGEIPGRSRSLITLVTIVAPVIELIRSTDIHDFRIQCLGAAERPSLSCMERESLSVAGRLSFPLAHTYHRVISIFTSF